MIDNEHIHRHTICNKDELSKSEIIVCIYCKKQLQFSQINDWTDIRPQDTVHRSDQHTGLCPFCRVDCLLGSASGVDVGNADLVNDLHEKWF